MSGCILITIGLILVLAHETRLFLPSTFLSICQVSALIVGLLLTAIGATRIAQDLKQARDELSDAQRQNKAKSSLVANIRHEVSTPMMGIIGMVDLLEGLEVPPNQRRMITTVKHSATDLLRIIDDVVEISNLEASEFNIQLEAVSLADIAEGVMQPLRTIAADRNVRLLLTLSPDAPKQVITDQLRVKQILTNLISNAIKFSARDNGFGKVSLAVERQDSESILLSVSDDGIGIHQSMLHKIFEPYTQVHASEQSKKVGGTGLGLYIVKQLVKQLNGKIEVESQPNEGTRFQVLLPMQEVFQASDEGEFSGITILALISDVLQTSGAEYLAKLGIRTEFLESELELWDRLEAVSGKVVVGLSLDDREETESLITKIEARFPTTKFSIAAENPMDWIDYEHPSCIVIQRYPMLISEMTDGLKSLFPSS